MDKSKLGKYVRSRGHRWELIVVNMLKEANFEAISARQESRTADASGIDIVSNFPFKIQCKDAANYPNFHKLLTETRAEIIMLRLRDKTKFKDTERIKIKGDYVIMELNKFLDYVKNNHSNAPIVTQ